MKVVLLKDVKALGHAGDVRDVADGYARNLLLPGGLVKIATQGAIKKAEESKAQREEVALKEMEIARELMNKIQGLSVALKAKADQSGKLYAAVKPEEIVEAVKAKGFEIEVGMIEIEEPIKSLGEFEVIVDLDHGLEAKVSVTIESE